MLGRLGLKKILIMLIYNCWLLVEKRLYELDLNFTRKFGYL